MTIIHFEESGRSLKILFLIGGIMSTVWLVFMTPYFIQLLCDNWQQSDMIRFAVGCGFTILSVLSMGFLLAASVVGFRRKVIVSDEGIRAIGLKNRYWPWDTISSASTERDKYDYLKLILTDSDGVSVAIPVFSEAEDRYKEILGALGHGQKSAEPSRAALYSPLVKI